MSPFAGGMWATAALRVLSKQLVASSKVLRSKLASAARPLNAELQPVFVRTGGSNRQPIHPLALLRQQKRGASSTTKWFSTSGPSIRRYLSNTAARLSERAPRFDRSKLPTSNTSRAVAQFTGRAPFACTLRPNLTGGALPRTAGGYAMPGGRAGGIRYFSHTPAAPAQVVQNVSQAVRAFWLSGQRAKFDGVDPNGAKRYRAVSAVQEETRIRVAQAPQGAPGAFIDFHISPTITALSPLGAAAGFSFSAVAAPNACSEGALNAEGFLDVLSVDFARALKDLAAIMTDLKRLAGLGDLPIVLEKNNILRVRFPGVDAETVERLCDDVGVQRGVVKEDPDFCTSAGVPMALRFPFAPEGEPTDCAKTLTSPGGSVRSHHSGLSTSPEDDMFENAIMDKFDNNPWLLPSSPPSEGYESMSPPIPSSSGEHCSEDFEGLEGIYRFLEECDRSKGRFQTVS
ncbi:hypothetical protein QBC37DRAFT_282149 [Rhypophila decipiens]|uniref:Uncharacterized protein n=1 Tax=Rhypophila decipiens TaxID=261697 RepID=A0AAN6YFN4_9PEZI|nr:hypothetical protein QBC37DRAFT_282149 [Rhypophila decipiens]